MRGLLCIRLSCRSVGSVCLAAHRMTPEWGSCARDLPPETQFLLLQLVDGGPYAVLLPLIDCGLFRATLRPPQCARPCRPTAQAWLQLRPGANTRDMTALLRQSNACVHGCIVPACSGVHESYGGPGRRKEEPNLLRLRIESGDEGVVAAHWDCAVLIAAGWDPFALVDAAVAEAARLSGNCSDTVHACIYLHAPHLKSLLLLGSCSCWSYRSCV